MMKFELMQLNLATALGPRPLSATPIFQLAPQARVLGRRSRRREMPRSPQRLVVQRSIFSLSNQFTNLPGTQSLLSNNAFSLARGTSLMKMRFCSETIALSRADQMIDPAPRHPSLLFEQFE